MKASHAARCTEEHARFCSACTTARAYNSIHCQDCPEGRPSAATEPSVRRDTFTVDLPCPRCGESRIIGYLFRNQNGEHMHTYYVCTFWRNADTLTRECGWHGWVVPGAS